MALSSQILVSLLAVTSLVAADHHGVVKSNGLPIPGATVTVSQADKRISTTTDEQGVYSFTNLADGIWNLEIEMLGFAKVTKEVGVSPDAPPAQWDLKLLSASEMKAALSPTPAASNAPAAPATSAKT